MKESRVAIDIGHCNIKVVEGFQKRSGFVISHIGMIENPLENFRESREEKDRAVLAGFLKDYCKKIRDYRQTSRMRGQRPGSDCPLL